VRDELLYEGDIGGGFTPFRRNIDFEKEMNQVPIVPLLPDLEFVKDIKKWGYPLMY